MTARPPIAAVVTLFAVVSTAFVAYAQSVSLQSASRPTFDVASIKRNTSADPGGSVSLGPGNRLIVTNIALVGLVRHAHSAQRWEMVPGGNLPAWMQTERWDIQATAATDATPAQVSDMFRNLLVDRFMLVAKRETRQVAVYDLVRVRADGRLGPQLRTSANDCAATQATAPACGTMDSRGRIVLDGARWANFPRILSLPAGRFIVDKTGITGAVDLKLTYMAEEPPAGAQSDSPSLFTAIQEQLGLRLEPGQALVDVLVIYSAERPTEN
jgi:uncharacterized protein (TIGR03435 family)